MYRERQYLHLSFSHSWSHTDTHKNTAIGFLVLPSAGDDDGISRLVWRTGSNKTCNHWKNGSKDGCRGGERKMELLGVFHGVRTSRGASTKVCLYTSMGLELIGIYPDMMNVKDVCFPFHCCLFHIQQISHRHLNEVKKH